LLFLRSNYEFDPHFVLLADMAPC